MVRFSPSDTVLVAIDLQRAFCAPDGSVAQQGRDIGTCAAAAARSYELVAAARAAGVRIVWTRMMFRPDYVDGGILVHELRTGMKKIGALRAGTPDVELMPEAKVVDGDIVIDKNRYSAFLGTDLDVVLRNLGARNLLVCGLTTSMCVETTVRDASQRDYLPYVVADACADFDMARHAASLAALDFGFARIIDMNTALPALDRADAAE